MLKVCVALTSLLLLTSCAPDASVSARSVTGADRPDTVDTTMSPTIGAKGRGSMTITPAAASPGQRIALRFPEDYVRGVAFSLADWNGQGWEVRYYLMSGRGSGSPTPEWWSVENREGRGWREVGVVGPGPDYVMVPSTAPRGTYRLCTANGRDEACALLTIGT
jgi:hypothetical protein